MRRLVYDRERTKAVGLVSMPLRGLLSVLTVVSLVDAKLKLESVRPICTCLMRPDPGTTTCFLRAR